MNRVALFTLPLLVAALATCVQAQKYPTVTTQTCSYDGCTTDSTSIVLDASPNLPASQYASHGVTIADSSIQLTINNHSGPRIYLAANDTLYKMFKMPGHEITYDMETSQLDCKTVGAIYFVQMPASGAAGADGYCDANCLQGACCPEMDLWEANQYATVMTTHVGSTDGGGCGLNPYNGISKRFYGSGSNYQVDTSKVFTVTTQFIQNPDRAGQVTEIRRLYQQHGRTIPGGSLLDRCNPAGMGDVMKAGSVLAMSVWWNNDVGWLDAGNNGPCPLGSDRTQATMTVSNIRYGPVGTTFPVATTCGARETDVDYYGDDLSSASVATADQCCSLCTHTVGCVAYTFASGGWCYMKKGAGTRATKAGAISAKVQVSVENGWCGSAIDGAFECPSGQYCQPWNPWQYQCRSLDAKCGVQEVGVDYFGGDIKTVQVTLPEQCCDACINTNGCAAYTFVNDNSDGKAYCYLKKNAGTRSLKAGAVSAKIQSPGCSTGEWAWCGNPSIGAQCCPSNQYCQPWDVNYFQCISKPDKCSTLYPQTDFYGNDIKTVFGVSPYECCEQCSNTTGCKAYTFVNDNKDTPACYLKSGSESPRSHVTAVSGLLN